MKKKNKVSFDFDDTLSTHEVQRFAKKLVDRGYEVWVVTSRLSNNDAGNSNWNRDLEYVCKTLGIKNVEYCGYRPKVEFFLENNDFLFHLDDDIEEIEAINKDTPVKGIHFVSTFNADCIKQCEELILKQDPFLFK